MADAGKKILTDAEMAAIDATPIAQPQAMVAQNSPSKKILSDEEMAAIDASSASNTPSGLTSLIRGGGQGVTMGYGDELEGGGEALYDKLVGNAPNKSLGDLYSQHTAGARAANEAAQKAHPYLYAGGNIGGGVLSTLATGGLGTEAAIAKAGLTGAKLAAARIAAGSAQGALASVGYGNADNVKDAEDDAIHGAKVGGAVSVGGELLRKFLNPAGLRETADNARVRSLNPNAPQYGSIIKTEQKLAEAARKAPQVATDVAADDSSAVGQTVNPIGTRQSIAKTMKDYDVGGSLQNKLEKFQDVNDAAGKGIEDTMSGLDASHVSPDINPQNLAEEIQAKFADPIEGFKSQSSSHKAVSDIVEDIKNNFNGDDFATLQKIKKFVGDQSNWDSAKSSDTNSLLKQVSGFVKGKIEDAVDQGADSLGNKDILSNYLKSKKDYGNSEIAKNILTGSTARQQSAQGLSLGDAVVASGELAAGRPLKAAATLGAYKATKLYGNNIKAGVYDYAADSIDNAANIIKPATNVGAAAVSKIGADKLADIIRSTPEALGPWGKQLSDALARGGASLGATNFMLQQTSPEYRQHISKLTGGN